MKRLFVLSILFLTNILLAQNIEFNFNYSKFNYDSSSIYLETYYSFGQKSLTVIEENGEKKYKAILHLLIKNLNTDSVYVDKDWLVEYPVNESDSTDKYILGTLGIILPEGKYSLQASGSDFQDRTIKEDHIFKIEAKPFSHTNDIMISDIQLSTSITKSENQKSLFYKNTYEVVPNPLSVYSETKPVMFYYLELYKFSDKKDLTEFVLEKKLINSRNETVKTETKDVKSNFGSSVDVGVVNLKSFPSGKYTFDISLVNKSGSIVATSRRDFFFINPSVIDSAQVNVYNTAYMTSEFGVMEEQELAEHYNTIKYIATDMERDQYEQIDSLNAKRKFLFNFWFKRDTNVDTPQNEALEDYKELVEYANKNFKTLGRKGFKTDRGRVYLQYGKPDQIERYTSESEYRPYMIWYYYGIEGGVSFIFGDLSGYGNYELMTSTKRGEVVNENWMNRIKIVE